jgi:hypothetical protein
LWFTPNYTYTSTSLTNPMLYFDGTATGSAPANSQLFTKFGCNDSVDYVTNGGAQAAGKCLWVIDNLSAGWTGQRLGLQAMVNVLAPSTATGFVSAAAFNASSAYNMGGTGAQPAGYLTAYHYDAEAYSGATYLVMLEGWEGATIVHPGASVAYVNGGKITVSGCTIPTASCNGLTIVGTGAQSASARIGLSFGSAETPTFGVAPTGTLIGSQAYVGGNTLSAAYGVDFSGVTISTGAFKSTGFLVDGSGNTTAASVKSTGSVFQGGTDYVNLEGVTAASGLAIFAPAGGGSLFINLSGTTAAVIGPSTTNEILTLQGNGTGGVEFGSGTWTANGSTSLSLTNIAPSGAHATVQEWFTVRNASGAVRYIPAF